MAKESHHQMQITRGTWYMDSCASRHLTNNRDLFVGELKAKSLDFTTASGQTLRAESIGTIAIPFANGTVKLKGVAYAPDCDANLISLRQLCESNITFVNDKSHMKLMQGGRKVARAKRDQNLFVLELATPNKVIQVTATNQQQAMTAQGRGRLTHLVSKNKRVQI